MIVRKASNISLTNFVDKGWITDVEYYYSVQDRQILVCGKTNKHHDVFYQSPLTQLLFRIGCYIHPNRYCKNIVDEGYIVISLPHRCMAYADDELKGIDALAQVVNRLILDARSNNK